MNLKKTRPAIVCFVLFSLWITHLSFAKKEEAKRKPPHCKKLTDLCAICSDGIKRVPGSQKIAKLSDYQCASKGKNSLSPSLQSSRKNCRTISNYCAVCKEGIFIFTKTGNHIRSDLYACATSPRTIQGPIPEKR